MDAHIKKVYVPMTETGSLYTNVPSERIPRIRYYPRRSMLSQMAPSVSVRALCTEVYPRWKRTD